MYDEVYCEADLPAGHPGNERAFQTKSLLRCLDKFTITKEGRLILHASRYEPSSTTDERLPTYVRIPAGDVDTEVHGDIRLVSTVEDQFIEYVARFTHGNLEWIRPWSKISDFHKELLTL